MRWQDIPSAIQDGGYGTDVSFDYLEEHLSRFATDFGCELEPDFQRGHVWAYHQQVAYMEAKLRRAIPHQTDIIRFNCYRWSRGHRENMVLVDGLQRLTAARAFLRDEVRVFDNLGGLFFSQFEGHVPLDISWRFTVNELQTRAEVLRWYLELNAGGTPHSITEIERVQMLLEREVICNR